MAERLKQALNAFGADIEALVKTIRWFAGSEGIKDFELATLDFASSFTR